MKQLISLSIADLTKLLKDRSLTGDELTIRVAQQRLTCGIGGCTWQGSDNTYLSSHVHVCHNEKRCLPENQELQIVLSEMELQQLAVQGEGIIEGNSFQIVQPVRFLFSIDGGRWYSEGKDRIYDTHDHLTAKEAQLLQQLQDTKNEHRQEIARKDEYISAQQEISNSDQVRIRQLEGDLREATASMENLQTQYETQDMLVEERQSQALAISTASHTLGDVNDTLVISTDAMRGLVDGVTETMNKGIMLWGAEQAENRKTIKVLTQQIATQKEQIAAQMETLRINEHIIDGALPVYRRFFVSAEKGMADSKTTNSLRALQHRPIVTRGNDAAHRANFLAHYYLWKGRHLEQDEIRVFEAMYGFHPEKYATMSHPTGLVDMYNMRGTMASFPQRIKLDNDKRHKEFLAHAEAIAKIRDSFKTAEGQEDEMAIKLAFERDLQDHLRQMKEIFADFVQFDKAERLGHSY